MFNDQIGEFAREYFSRETRKALTEELRVVRKLKYGNRENFMGICSYYYYYLDIVIRIIIHRY